MSWKRVGLLVGVWAVTVTALAGIRPIAPAAVTARMGAVDHFVSAEMRRQKAPGVAIAIVSQGQVIAAKGYGEADVELHVPVGAVTLFQSGSLGKQFTATAVMLLVEEGKLALDDPITKYFTDAPRSWRAITVRNLLTHTSGIPDYEEASGTARAGNGIIDYRRDYTDEELAKMAYRLPLQFAPGTRWRYSNTGYVLLGLLVRKVSGRFYGDILRDQVFRPLGMKTARVISQPDIIPNRASGYRLLNGELKNQEWVSPTLDSTADGSLYLSAADWVAWDRGLRAGAILKPQSWAQIYTPVRLKSGKSYPYGFGWQVDQWQGQPWYHHGGSWQGFKTYISRYLADDLTIVVLVNLADADPERFVDGIAGAIDSKLPQIEPTIPIADHNPQVTARVRKLLEAAAQGKLRAADFPFERAGFAWVSRGYERLLRPLGSAQKLDLVDQRALGNDEAYSYLAAYAGSIVRVEIEIMPDGRFADFNVESE